MNNSNLGTEKIEQGFALPEVDPMPRLKAHEQKLVNILTAIDGIKKTGEWSTLKTEVFDPLTSTLERHLKDEAKKENPDTNKLNRLAGQLKWSERYSDLEKMATVYRNELSAVRKSIYGK